MGSLKRKKKNYLRDNSVIFLERSYRQEGLRPRCWTKITSGCRSSVRLACSAIKILHDLSLGRRELDRFLSAIIYTFFLNYERNMKKKKFFFSPPKKKKKKKKKKK